MNSLLVMVAEEFKRTNIPPPKFATTNIPPPPSAIFSVMPLFSMVAEKLSPQLAQGRGSISAYFPILPVVKGFNQTFTSFFFANFLMLGQKSTINIILFCFLIQGSSLLISLLTSIFCIYLLQTEKTYILLAIYFNSYS